MKIDCPFLDSVGNMSLIRLRRASERTGCSICGKAEFMNPGGSVKDRAAKYLLLDALEQGIIRPGGVVVEGTAGNTGIGQNRVTGNLKDAQIDDAFNIPDSELIPVLWELIGGEGLYVGASSALNVAGATRLAGQLGPGHTIVTILCDSARSYESRLFDAEFLESRGLQPPPWVPR